MQHQEYMYRQDKYGLESSLDHECVQTRRKRVTDMGAGQAFMERQLHVFVVWKHHSHNKGELRPANSFIFLYRLNYKNNTTRYNQP